MSPRILFLDHVGVLGGAELYLLDVARYFRSSSQVVLFEDGPFAEALRENGVRLEVLTTPRAVRDVVRKGNVLHDLRAAPGVMMLALKVARLARNYDLIYANSQKSLIVAALGGVLARRQVIWNLHDILTASHFSAFHRALSVRIANTFVARVIVNSKATLEAFSSSGGRAEKVGIVYNGIDADAYASIDPSAIRRLRTELGLTDKPVVGIFSRLAPWKGQHVLLEALASLPNVHAILVGAALFDSDLQYVDDLKQLAGELGIRERAHFLGFRRDVPHLMHLVDVIVHASVAAEPFGRVIVEGMLAKKPVVATAAGGAIEIINDGETGLLVPPGDAQALSEAVAMLTSRPALAARIGQAARHDARLRFSREAMMSEVVKQVAKVVEAA